MSENYAEFRNGEAVSSIEGWTMLPEGEKVPQVHREFIEDYVTNKGWWCAPRRCRSTMTPIVATVWGGVRAIAVPTEI